MKKPESPPSLEKNILEDNTIQFLLKEDFLTSLYKIERENYPYWEELKYRTKKWPYPSKKIWSFLKHQRKFSQQTLDFSHHPGFTFHLNVPGLLQKYLHELDMNLGGFLEGNIIPSQDKNRYLISSIMEEAISSSQLEGAATTRKVAKEMLEKQRPPKDKSEKMILNNFKTMQWIVDNKNIKLTPEILLSIHKTITNGTLHNSLSEGEFRINNDVKVMDETNEIFYIPPDYKIISNLLDEFFKLANHEIEIEFVHPIIKGIILHFLIGYIHPFADGNGRTARAIFYWYLISKGYWLIEYMSISRIILRAPVQYAQAYLHTEYDDNDLTYFILYNIKALHVALHDLKKYIYQKTEERKKTISLLKSGSYNERQVVIIKDVLQNPDDFFTVKQIETRFGINNQTARNDLMNLQKKGILQLRMTGNKAQFFAADNFEKNLKF
ncbi:MAG: Fic family protein [Bacteroidota bacterium]|nr:Fic family protein [Bacteroidota bacterium]